MKIALGIFGTIIGTMAGMAVANVIAYGSVTNLSAVVYVAIILGTLNGAIIAMAARRSAAQNIGHYAAAGAAGMGVLYFVFMGLLCLTLGMMFTMPSAKDLFLSFVAMAAIGGVTGVCYRAFSALR